MLAESDDVNFNNDSNITAVTIFINMGTGVGNVNVYRYQNAPKNVSGITGIVSQYRWIIQQEGLAGIIEGKFFEGQVKFKLSEIPNNGISNPNNVKVYSRPIPGSGAFTELVTTYNSAGDEIIAEVTSFSEFAFGSEDQPLPVDFPPLLHLLIRTTWS